MRIDDLIKQRENIRYEPDFSALSMNELDDLLKLVEKAGNSVEIDGSPVSIPDKPRKFKYQILKENPLLTKCEIDRYNFLTQKITLIAKLCN